MATVTCRRRRPTSGVDHRQGPRIFAGRITPSRTPRPRASGGPVWGGWIPSRTRRSSLAMSRSPAATGGPAPIDRRCPTCGSDDTAGLRGICGHGTRTSSGVAVGHVGDHLGVGGTAAQAISAAIGTASETERRRADDHGRCRGDPHRRRRRVWRWLGHPYHIDVRAKRLRLCRRLLGVRPRPGLLWLRGLGADPYGVQRHRSPAAPSGVVVPVVVPPVRGGGTAQECGPQEVADNGVRLDGVHRLEQLRQLVRLEESRAARLLEQATACSVATCSTAQSSETQMNTDGAELAVLPICVHLWLIPLLRLGTSLQTEQLRRPLGRGVVSQ